MLAEHLPVQNAIIRLGKENLMYNLKNPSGKIARWAIRLRAHILDIYHRKGLNNVVSDAVSRIRAKQNIFTFKTIKIRCRWDKSLV